MFTANIPGTPIAGNEEQHLIKTRGRKNGHTVLVVDSDKNTLEFLSNFFSQQNCFMVSATSLNDAVEKCRDKKIGLMLSEFLLGDHSCLEIMMLLRKTLPDLPVVIMSENEELISEKDALNFSADYFLTKPLEIEKLERIVSNCFNQNELFS